MPNRSTCIGWSLACTNVYLHYARTQHKTLNVSFIQVSMAPRQTAFAWTLIRDCFGFVTACLTFCLVLILHREADIFRTVRWEVIAWQLVALTVQNKKVRRCS